MPPAADRGRRPSARSAGTATSAPAAPARHADLLLVACIAAFLRIVHLVAVGDDPLFRAVTGDSEVYVARARALLAGQVDAAHAFTAPLYPLLLAAVFTLWGEALDVVRWLQAGCGVLASTLTAAAAGRLFGRRAALVAGLALAASPVAIFFDGELLAASAVLALIALGVHAVARALDEEGSGHLFVAGAAFVAAAAGQPQALVFVPGALPAALARGPRGRRTASLLLGAGVLFLVFSLLQHRASGHWVGLSAGAGVNFYIGNHAGAEGGFALPPASGLVNSSFGLYPSARAGAAAARGDTTLGPAEVSRYWTGQALAWIGAQPAAAATLFCKKLLLAVNHYDVPNHYPLAYFAARSPVLAWTPVRFVWLGPLGLAGIAFLLARRERAAGWLALTTALLLLALALFFVTDRYRLLMWPVLALGAAAALEVALAAVRARDRRRLAMLIAGTAALVLVSALGPHPEFGRAEIHLIKSTVLAESGDAAGARRELELAAGYRELAAASHNLANAYFRERRYSEAAGEYRQALALDPDQVASLHGLGLAELALGRREEAARALAAAAALAPGDRKIAGDLARARGAGDTTRARQARPPEVAALFAQALAAARAGEHDSARAGFERVLALAPNDGAAHLNLALLAEQDGDLATAQLELAKAAAAPGGGDHLELVLARGRVAAKAGDLTAARRHFARAIEVAPADERARRALAALGGAANPP